MEQAVKEYLSTCTAGVTSKPIEIQQGCGSGTCPRAKDCARFCHNLTQPAYIENYASFGWASISIDKDGKTSEKGEYWCGPLGDYKMFIPMSTKS